MFALGCPDDPPADDDDTTAGDDDDVADDDDDVADDDDTVDIEGIIGGVQVNDRTDATSDGGAPVETHSALVWGFYEQPWPGEIFGMVYSPMDGATSWEVEAEAEDGECGWLSFERAVCDPPCDYFGEYCDPGDGVCEEYPEFAPAGSLSLQGLNLSLDWDSDPYWPQEVPAGSISPGEILDLSASGAATPTFSVSATAVAPLQHDMACDPAQLFSPGEDFEVTWTAAGDDRVRLEVIPWNHGGAKARIYCDSPDDGTLIVPSALVDEFLAGAEEFHGLFILTRYHLGVEELGNGHQVALEIDSSWQCYHWY
jgi:hypothetical protein